MYIVKKTRLHFFSELRNTFPEIAQLTIWNENDYLDDPSTSSEIMTKIGEVVIKWSELNEIEKIKKLMSFIEQSYQSYNDEITSYIYTDFLPTIISMENSALRNNIKKQILKETMKHYNQLIELGFYKEN